VKILKSAFALAALFLSAVLAFATNGIPLQMQAGNPSSATVDTSNHSHYLMQRAQYALDYNDTLGQPNWVSWDLTNGDHGSVSRSDFVPDPDLPSGFYAVTTDDYNGVGNINFNRGHMTPSADRNDTVTNNIPAFYMTNIVPQAADNNQGPWEVFETECRTLASAGNELLIVSGASQYLGSKIPSGKAYIPGYTWKIVLVIPTGSGTAASRATASTRVIALKMPNVNGIRSNPWESYKTTVAQIAADTGFTFFTGLDPAVASALRNAPVDGAPNVASPIITTQPAAQAGPVGSTVSFSVVADANGNPPLTYRWRKDGDDIADATNATLTLTNIQAASIGNYSVVVFNTVGSTSSANAALVVSGIPPSISTQPASQSTPAGTAVTFTVAAAGSPTLSYQWRQGTTNLVNSTHISGVTAPVLTINNPQAADALSYNVVVTNTVSSVTSDSVLLTVTPAAPTITGQPLAQTVAPAGTAVFTVTAAGTEPFTYQWAKGGVPISGNASATTATLTLTNVQLADAASYSVTVSNGVGASATSNNAALTVSAAVNAKAYTGGTYTQNFDTLPNSGTFTLSGAGPFAFSAAPFNLSALSGWSFAKLSGTGSNALFNFGTGSSNAGSVYSFGAASNAERSLGAVLSGSVASAWGLVLTNNTGTTITQFTVSYTGEQWRYGGRTNASLADTVAFEYQVGGSDIATGTFTAATSLNFSAPVYNGAVVGATTYGSSAATLVGNDAGYRTAISSTITGVNWAPGQALVLRWKDNDVTGSDDGLSIDDFSFTTPVGTAPTTPSVVTTSPANAATNVAVATPITVTFNQAVNVTGTWFALSSTNTGPITPTVNTTDFITFTFTPPTNLAFGDTVTLNLFAAQITEKVSGTLHPAANTTVSFTTVTPTPPSIVTQPVATTVAAGGTATFSVTASGTAPLSYQWRKDGIALSGNTSATTPTLTLANVQSGDAASYDVVVTNGINPSATSNAVALTVTPVAPSITTQPVAQSSLLGGTVSFTVAATGSTPLTYQWRKGGVAITGNASATTATLTLTAVTAGDAGNYDVVVSNGVGSPAVSNSVALSVSLSSPGQLAYSGGTYLQSFDTLPNTGTFTFTNSGPIRLDDSAGINATGLGGWSFARYAGSGSVALFRFDTGASNSGAVYSYGAASATDRALGSLSSGTAASRFGVTLVNTGSETLTQFTLSYTGEQWRHGGATTANKLAFSYGVGATDINTGTFTNTTALDFTGLSVSATGSALDGNLAANRAAITATITGLSWAPGQTLVLRWSDVDDAGSDDGLSIDDLTFAASAPPPIIPATVALSDLAPTYDGTAKSATATTTPAGLAVSLTYNGSATAPINAGSYAVVATVTQPGYSGTASGTLVIGKATAAVTLGDLAATYDGTPKAASVGSTPGGLAFTLTYDGSATAPTNVGSYAVVATIVDANYVGSASGTLTISPAVATIALADLSQVYTGASLSATATTSPAGLNVSLTYDGSATAPVNAGSYAVVATISDANYVGSASATLTIAKAPASIALGNLSTVYDGTLRIASATTTPSGLAVSLTYNGSATAPVNAGSYAVSAAIVSPNYTGGASGTLVVAKAPATVALAGLATVYDGTARIVTATTTPAGLTTSVTYDGSATAPVNAGSYAIAAAVTDANYTGSIAGTLVVDKAVATVALAGLATTYDGSARVVTATTTPAGLATSVTYDGSAAAPVNAGSYAIAAAVTDANYLGSASGTLVVAKAPATLAFSGTAQIYDGSAKPVAITTTPAGLATSLTYDGAASAPTNAGTYALAASVTDANYTGSATGSLTIGQAVASISLTNLSQTYNGSPKSVTVTTTPAGLASTVTYNGSATAPTNAGSYAVAVTINDANYTGSTSGTLVIAKAAATLALSNTAQTYDGTAKSVTVTTTPAALSTAVLYDGSATAPTAAGTYAVSASVTDANYTGSTTGSLTIAKATASIALSNLSQVYDGSAKSVTATTTPAGLSVSVTYNGSATAPSAVGSYAVAATVTQANYVGSASGTLTITPTSGTIVLSDLTQLYDGTPKSVTVTTTPSGLTFSLTYNGSATAPTAPGSYAVVATLTSPGYSGSASGTLTIATQVIVRHAPTLNAGVDGSIQVLLPESTTLNGNAYVSGDLLLPGTPTVQLNGHPTYAGTIDGTGAASPSNYTVTLNGNAVLRRVVRRTDAIAMLAVSAPPSPTGTRSVSLNSASDSAGDFATLRNLTLNGNAGTRTIPAGTYGAITVNGNSALVLGVAGATTPSVYNLQSLTLNGNTLIQIVGPVVINLASGVSANSSIGSSAHPEWLVINVASGGFTLNGNIAVNGCVNAPSGTVTVNGNSVLRGVVTADRLTINGNALLDAVP
jgi:DNA/RNA endonuclease G (NUC1)